MKDTPRQVVTLGSRSFTLTGTAPVLATIAHQVIGRLWPGNELDPAGEEAAGDSTYVFTEKFDGDKETLICSVA
jgi:hypothetical protein